MRLGPAGTRNEKRPRRSVTALPAGLGGAPRRRTVAVATIVWPANDCPAESVSRPRSLATRPKGTFTRPERTLRKRRPTFALVAERRVGLPCATLPATSRTVTRMSTREARPRSSLAREPPVRDLGGERPVRLGSTCSGPRARRRRHRRRASLTEMHDRLAPGTFEHGGRAGCRRRWICALARPSRCRRRPRRRPGGVRPRRAPPPGQPIAAAGDVRARRGAAVVAWTRVARGLARRSRAARARMPVLSDAS